LPERWPIALAAASRLAAKRWLVVAARAALTDC
jgi:hypothetical protein